MRSPRYSVAYQDLYGRYVIVLDNQTGRYSRYDIDSKGKHVLSYASASEINNLSR